MPIINEIDEENAQNSRTINTDTGVYLTYGGANGWERVANFTLCDSDAELTIFVEFSNKLDEENKTNKYKYLITKIDFIGSPNKKGYSEIISQLLNTHGWNYRKNEKKFGNIQSVDIDFKPQVVEKLNKKSTN